MPEQMSAGSLALWALLTGLNLSTLIGNLFVITAILVDRNLQTTANQLVLSLAVADLMVACLVMPLGAYNDLHQGWYLGTGVCEFWTSADVLCCTASILNLLAIALDRYWAVTNVDYIYRRTRRRIMLMIFCVWTVGAVVSLAPIFGWKDPRFAERVLVEHKCMVSQDVAYQVFATVSTFYAPLVLLLALYWRIFQVARKRIRRKPGERAPAPPAHSPAAVERLASGAAPQPSEAADPAGGRPEPGPSSAPLQLSARGLLVDVAARTQSLEEHRAPSARAATPAGDRQTDRGSGAGLASCCCCHCDTCRQFCAAARPIEINQGRSAQYAAAPDKSADAAARQDKRRAGDSQRPASQSTPAGRVGGAAATCLLAPLALSVTCTGPSSCASSWRSRDSSSASRAGSLEPEVSCASHLSSGSELQSLSEDFPPPLMGGGRECCRPGLLPSPSPAFVAVGPKRSLDLRGRFRALGQLVSFVQTSRNYSYSSPDQSEQEPERELELQVTCSADALHWPARAAVAAAAAAAAAPDAATSTTDADTDQPGGPQAGVQPAPEMASGRPGGAAQPPPPPPPDGPARVQCSRPAAAAAPLQSISARGEAERARKCRANMDVRREKKAAKTLAIITGVFVCCWLPFFLNAIIMPVCGDACTPSDLILSILLWLGYLNSLLNPIIYTIFSPDFRRAFRRLLFWWHKAPASQQKPPKPPKQQQQQQQQTAAVASSLDIRRKDSPAAAQAGAPRPLAGRAKVACLND